MAIPVEIIALIDRLNQELAETEQETTEGLNLARASLSRFPDNVLLIQFFAYLNTILIFAENSKRRIQTLTQGISTNDVTTEEIQEAGEDLGTLLGQVLEAKIEVKLIITRWQNLL